MDSKKILEILMKKENVSQTELAHRLGYKNQSGVSQRLHNAKGMRVDVLARFLNALGAELIIRKDDEEWHL